MSRYPLKPVRGVGLDDVAWFTGNWKGHIKGELIEESWSAVENNSLMGMFRWFRDGKVWFYEFLLIETDGDELVMRLKHFNPRLVGWEEKESAVEFVLTRLEGREAVFLQRGKENPPWLIYRQEDDETLLVYFDREEKPVTVDGIFRYSRS